MRRVRVPRPIEAWELRVDGPVSPSAPDIRVAWARLENALAALPRLDRALGDAGWTIAWRSSPLEAGHVVRSWLWCVRTERGADLAQAVAAHLEFAGFLVRRAPRPGRAEPELLPRVVYLRSGTVGLGLEPRSVDLFNTIEVVEEDREDIDFDLRYRFGAQRCPSCRVDDVPLALVAGFPSSELLLSAELGEVAFADGGLVDRKAGKNARCRRCGAEFVAR